MKATAEQHLMAIKAATLCAERFALSLSAVSVEAWLLNDRKAKAAAGEFEQVLVDIYGADEVAKWTRVEMVEGFIEHAAEQPKASRTFRKGDKVTYIGSWDGMGTFYYTFATVVSCGAKQMTLQNTATGEMMGCNFLPNADRTYNMVWQDETFVRNYSHFTAPDMSVEQAKALCIEAATHYIKSKNDHYDHCLAGGHGDAYDRSIKASRERLHEPRAISHAEGLLAVAAQV